MNFCVSVRELLTTARTYYVRTDGSNSNTGLVNNAGGAFLTIQHAINVVCDAIDNQGFDVTIQVQDATWTESLLLRPFLGRGLVTLRGNVSTPASCVLSPVTGRCVAISESGCNWYVAGFTFTTAAGFSHVGVFGPLRLHLGSCRFGSSGSYHVEALYNAAVDFTTDCEIVGGAGAFVSCGLGAVVDLASRTFTLTGTPAFSQSFILAQSVSVVTAFGTTFSGAATGKRYTGITNSVINTFGGGANFFPGNVAGTVATGGQYV